MKAFCPLLASLLLMSLTLVLGEVKYMQPLSGGGMLLHDVSYDHPDYHFVGASPLGGVLAADIGDSYVAAAGLGLPGIPGGLNAIPAPLYTTGVVGGYSGLMGRVRPYTKIVPRRRYGKRVRLFNI